MEPTSSPTLIPPGPKPFPLNPILVTISVLSLLATTFFIYQNYLLNQKLQQLIVSQTITTTPLNTPTPTPTLDTANWKTYSLPQYGYEFKYPSNLKVYSETESFVNLTYIPVCDPLVRSCLYIPSEMFAGTNFKGAGLGVLITKATTADRCQPDNLNPAHTDLGNKVINKISYHLYNRGSAAAGNQAGETNYYTFQNQQCYLITSTFTTDSSDLNVPGGKIKSITPSEKEEFNQLIEKVLTTFKFSPITNQSTITTPLSNAIIKSPLTVKGTVPQGWMFEGVFSIKLLDQNRKPIALAQGKEIIPGSSYGTLPIEFTSSITFQTNATQGYLVLDKDNPSGLPEKNESFEIPIRFK